MLAMSLAFLPIKISAENVPNIILKSEGERKDFSFDSNWISVTLAAVKNIIFNYANDNLSNFQKTNNNHSDNKNNNDNNNNNNNNNYVLSNCLPFRCYLIQHSINFLILKTKDEVVLQFTL